MATRIFFLIDLSGSVKSIFAKEIIGNCVWVVCPIFSILSMNIFVNEGGGGVRKVFF